MEDQRRMKQKNKSKFKQERNEINSRKYMPKLLRNSDRLQYNYKVLLFNSFKRYNLMAKIQLV